ncbi:DUF4105 domain-containing protein [Parabacteroides sp. OttesenSCG-928-G07]|nr:DUF4105 domain-containing protein [Parabacteroides sp. OttesenSCG-928-G07]
MKPIYRLLLLSLLAVCTLPLFGQAKLSEQARISVLTSAPHDGAVFTVFGHAAFRVHDPELELDIIFNYGVFDFTKSNFVYRFAKGETDYKLAVNAYLDYIFEYQMRGSNVTELVLNLTEQEKSRLWEALVINAQPENAVYRYNFFFDNCATRLPQMVEKYVNGEVIYNNSPASKTFRQMVHDCTAGHPWLTFGIDLALGSPADRVATAHEMMFLPDYVEDEFSKATIKDHAGVERPLVTDTIVVEAVELDEEGIDWLTIFTPLICGWLFFLLIAVSTFKEWKKKKYFRFIDITLFTLAGLAGVVLFFLSFISEHPAIWPNWSVLWLHPFHLIGVVLFGVKRWWKAAFCYHFINFAVLTLMILGWGFIPQELNAAFLPLAATLWLRSGFAVYRFKRDNK